MVRFQGVVIIRHRRHFLGILLKGAGLSRLNRNRTEGRDRRNRRNKASGGVIRLFLASLLAGTAQGADLPKEATSAESGTALVTKYCLECHGDGAHKGNFALDDLMQADRAQDRSAEWTKVWKTVRHEFMPPAGAARPTPAERRTLSRWLEETRLGIDLTRPDPGRVTVRRLNRMEYEYTITDLFGVNLSADQDFMSDRSLESLKLRDRLPPDDTAFGFDNNGDFLSLSPALLDKFFNLAEYVVDHVISVNGPQHPQTDLGKAGFKVQREEATRRVEQLLEFEVARPGNYRLEVQFTAGNFAEIAGTFEFQFQSDDQVLARDEVLIGGHRTHRYGGDVTLAAGRHRVQITTKPIHADAKGKLNYLEFRPRLRLVGPVGPPGVGVYEYPEPHRQIFFQGDAPAEAPARAKYARAVVQRVADRAFRRPADSRTLDRLTEIVLQNPSFEAGVGQALTAILSSPKFLFRAEQQPTPDDPRAIHPIDEYALASRLSYLFWLSLPDAELTRLAEQGLLRQNLAAQVQRLLADPRSERFFEDFPGQWLRTRNVLMTAISVGDGPLNPVRFAMKRETELLFEHIVREDRDLLELLTADYTYVDRKLAEFYGLKNFAGEGFQRIALPPESHRGGVLTHGSFLVSTSNPNRTSPVKRGLFVLENLLGIEIPPPPANIPPLDAAQGGGTALATVREQLAAHRQNKSCAACHAHFDPIGLVLENFDLVGQWRERENGAAIETRETSIGGEPLTGVPDLRNLLGVRKAEFYRCVTEKLLTYALGRGLEPADARSVDGIADQVMAGNGRFSTLLQAVIASPAFQLRRGDAGEVKLAPRSSVPVAPPPEQRKGRRPKPPVTSQLSGTTNRTPEKAAAPLSEKP